MERCCARTSRSDVVRSVAYPPDSEGFGVAYFRDHHAPMFADLLGDNWVRYEVHDPLPAPGARPPPFAGAAYFWVTSPEQSGAALSEHGPMINADIERFSRIQPVRGWAEVVGEGPS